MTGIEHITLNGKEERLRFNQYARAELAKFLIPEGEAAVTQLEVTRVIIKEANKNLPALLKRIVYAGILGDSLVYGNEPRLSQEQVGEFIGDASDEELYRIWKAFLDVQSVEPEKEEGEEQKKK